MTLNLNGGVVALHDVHARDVAGGSVGPHPGGAVVPGEAGASSRYGAVGAEALSRLAGMWVEPPEFATLTRATRTVIVLRGPRGSGRYGMAVHLLNGRYRLPIRQLEPDCPLADLDPASLEPATGYVVELTEQSPPPSWRLQWLHDAFSKTGCRLVIVVDGSWRPDWAATDFVVDVATAAAPTSLLAAYLSYEFRGERERDIRTLVRDERVRTLLTRLLVAEEGLHGLVWLAAELVPVLAGERQLDEVEARVRSRTLLDAAAWFLTGLEGPARCFAVALAVLDGLPYDEVLGAATDLERRLAEAAPPPAESDDADAEKSTVDNRLYRHRSQLLAACRAEVFTTEQNVGYGRIDVEAVRFSRNGYPFEIIRTFWREFDLLRPTLLAWLFGLGRSRSRRVRIGAAAAAGLLTMWSFDLVRRSVLTPWADGGQGGREAAAVALAIPAAADRYRDAVLRTLWEWGDQSGRPGRRVAAARAWGAAVGGNHPDEAFRRLGDLIVHTEEDLPLYCGIRESMAELFITPGQSMVDPVLDILVEWWKEKPRVRLSVAMTFLWVSAVTRTQAIPDADTWPAMPALTASSPDRRRRVAALLSRALNLGPSRQIALDVIHDWALDAEHDERLRVPLAKLIATATSTERDESRLRFHLDRWRRGDEAVPRTVEAIVVELHKTKGER
ncbi:MAG: hypothetical protein ACJ73E_05630 [Mycobacteriales bacterium]